jgi:hypothetical protein
MELQRRVGTSLLQLDSARPDPHASYENLARKLSEVSLLDHPACASKALRDSLCVWVRFPAVVWFVLIGMERGFLVRGSHPELCLPSFWR